MDGDVFKRAALFTLLLLCACAAATGAGIENNSCDDDDSVHNLKFKQQNIYAH